MCINLIYNFQHNSNANVTYGPGMMTDTPPKRGQGHPLKSFSVPGPPSGGGVVLNPSKHGNGTFFLFFVIIVWQQHYNEFNSSGPTVTIRPQNSSPYKKSVAVPPIVPPTTAANRLQQGGSVAHSNDEIQRLAPSTSTEELNQEMANLEGLMKDLSAITANEFEC